MRDYDNMPKIDWKADNGTVARIKAQINVQEPLIIRLPDGFDLALDESACGCEAKNGLLIGCNAQDTFAVLAESNTLSVLNEIGRLAHDRGQIVDIDKANNSLVVYD